MAVTEKYSEPACFSCVSQYDFPLLSLDPEVFRVGRGVGKEVHLSSEYILQCVYLYKCSTPGRLFLPEGKLVVADTGQSLDESPVGHL